MRDRRLIRAWKAARPWLLDHLQELQAKGWTRKQLFKAGKLSFPHGPWGPAWARNWLGDGVKVSIDQDGAIRWTWIEPGGRQVSQAAYPKH